jgi:hypothetical protein
MCISHIGHSTLHIDPTRILSLKNVLHVPSSNKNLVSIHRFTHDNHVFVEYHPYVFLVKDLVTRRVLLRGKCKGGLYPFPSLENAMSRCVLSTVRPSLTCWHDRLGHPSMIVVQKVLDANKISFAKEKSAGKVCDACQCARSHQLLFTRSISVSKAPLELVFSYVWGPAPTSVGRNNCYVSFINDYSKFTWIYLLKHKSEVFEKFHIFEQHVERLLGREIISMQMDWGGEYQKLNSFFTNIGISHHVSCPHTHQQNGAAERKHRHIVEVGLSLLSHASMPLKFWDEAYLTAVFLINRTPSKVIKFQTPMQHLLGNALDYSILRTFGCACWPNLRPYNAHKLSFYSKRCVFLGYSNQHKGYKCLEPSYGRVFVSHDVIFDETVFCFLPFIQMPEPKFDLRSSSFIQCCATHKWGHM